MINDHLNIGNTIFLSRSMESVVDSASIAGYILVDRFLGNSKDIGRERLHSAMFGLPRLIKPRMTLSKLIISQTNCEIT